MEELLWHLFNASWEMVGETLCISCQGFLVMALFAITTKYFEKPHPPKKFFLTLTSVGIAAGIISVLWVPDNFLQHESLRFINLFISPAFAALGFTYFMAVALIAKQQDDSNLPTSIDRKPTMALPTKDWFRWNMFAYSFIYAFTIALLRYWFTK